MTMTTPGEVYRLMTRDEWEKAARDGAVSYGALDRRDGFLHLSTLEQMFETAQKYFAGRSDMLAIEIPCAVIMNDLKFEPVAERGGALFPHLYGPLPTAAVTRALLLNVDASGGFVLGDEVS